MKQLETDAMQARNGAHSSEGKGKIHSNPVGYGRTSEAVHGDGTLRRFVLTLCLFYLHSTIDTLSMFVLQGEKAHTETTNQSLVQENQMLLQQIDDLRDKFEDLRKEHEERSKAELMVLVKEVKSFRTSQSEPKQELTRTMKEKLEMDVR